VGLGLSQLEFKYDNPHIKHLVRILVPDDVDICVSCVKSSINKINQMLVVDDPKSPTSLLQNCVQLLKCGRPPAAPNPIIRASSARSREEYYSTLLYDMRIFTFEECIKYAFITLEKLHEQFLDAPPIKKWHSEFNRFVNECVLPQILINNCNLLASVDDSLDLYISDIHYSMDGIGPRSRPWEHYYA